MTEIPLSNGGFALVDDEDVARVGMTGWHKEKARSKNTKCWYARHWDGTYMHRIIMDAKRGQHVDHVSRDGLDNQKRNLRFCSLWENSLNASPRLGTSKYKGVCFRKDSGKWRARIRVRGKLIQLGNFTNEKDAARCYDEAAKEHFGDFAYLNNLPKAA